MNQVVMKKDYNEVPWDGLGYSVKPEDKIKDALIGADLNWSAKRTKVCYNVGSKLIVGTNDVLYRSDNNKQLGIVSDKYNVVQPEEVIKFYTDIVNLRGWHLDVIGQVDDGKRIWALAKTDASFNAARGDKIDIYLLLSTTFDGSSSTIGKFTSVRVACSNTLSLAVGKNEKMGKVSVHHKAIFNPKEMQEKLGIYLKATNVFEEQVKVLTKAKVDDKQAVRFLIDTLEKPNFDPDKLSARQGNIIKAVFEMYKGGGRGATLDSCNGTAWGLLNAITQHIDYNVGRNVNNRMRSAWFGLGETLKIKTFDQLLKLSTSGVFKNV
jgi:phage/plasmid-like protein (TIGR03299 family)